MQNVARPVVVSNPQTDRLNPTSVIAAMTALVDLLGLAGMLDLVALVCARKAATPAQDARISSLWQLASSTISHTATGKVIACLDRTGSD